MVTADGQDAQLGAGGARRRSLMSLATVTTTTTTTAEAVAAAGAGAAAGAAAVATLWLLECHDDVNFINSSVLADLPEGCLNARGNA